MNLLVVSAGSEWGIEAGMEFTIHRGDGFVCNAVVEKADKYWSSCRIIKEFEKSRPRVGDSASSRVY